MAKFNSTNTIKTTNKSGHAAYKLDAETDLVTKVLTSMFNEEKFYGDTSNDLIQLAETTDMKFVTALAAFARKEFHMRSVAHVLTAIVARYGKGDLTRKAIMYVVERPDDILEIMSAYKALYGKPWPNAMKRQMALEMNTINEYNFAKYNGGNKGLKFKDVLRITHAKPISPKMEETFNHIMNDTLPTPYTWEVELSKKGNNKQTWEELIASGKVGYMALLRNLRNIILANPDNIDLVYQTLADPEKVRKSKQLPFRFYSAYKAVKNIGTSKTFDALEDAIAASCENIPRLSGKTLVAIDVSGSMGCNLSGKSKVTCADIACVMGAIASHICEDSEVVTFDTTIHKEILSTRSGILANAGSMVQFGGGTNIQLPFNYMLQHKKFFDRVILLSDNEINRQWDNPYDLPVQITANKYRNKVNPNLWIHAIDLAGYGTSQFCGDKTNILAGWSEQIFDFIKMREDGIGNLVKTIENYF